LKPELLIFYLILLNFFMDEKILTVPMNQGLDAASLMAMQQN
jgi:hypothetical protein